LVGNSVFIWNTSNANIQDGASSCWDSCALVVKGQEWMMHTVQAEYI
jgi:hypothetical protein